MSDETERARPEADEAAQRDEGDDVEGHGFRGGAEDKFAATEEGPDVEAHLHKPKAKP